MGVGTSALVAFEASSDPGDSGSPANSKLHALLAAYPRSMVGTDASFRLLWLMARHGCTDALEFAVHLARCEPGVSLRRAMRGSAARCLDDASAVRAGLRRLLNHVAHVARLCSSAEARCHVAVKEGGWFCLLSQLASASPRAPHEQMRVCPAEPMLI
jgi:hypothetical protein